MVKLTPHAMPDQSPFDLLTVKLCGPAHAVVVVLYRPPKPSNVFTSEHSTILTTLNEMSPNVILIGDLNLHPPTYMY